MAQASKDEIDKASQIIFDRLFNKDEVNNESDPEAMKKGDKQSTKPTKHSIHKPDIEQKQDIVEAMSRNAIEEEKKSGVLTSKKKHEFTTFSYVLDDDDQIAQILGITEHSNMLHLRTLSTGCCLFEAASRCREIADDDLEDAQKRYGAKQALLPPLFEWNASHDEIIASYFPSYRKRDPHYNKAKAIYLKTVCLLQQSESYIKNTFVGYCGPQTFHDAPVPSFSTRITEFGQTQKSKSGIEIDLYFKFIHLFESSDYVASDYDQYASIFIGSITFYHELIHWLRFVLCGDEPNTPENLKSEGGFDAEVTNTTGLWSCDWAGDNEIFDVWHFKISDECQSYRLKDRSEHETAYVLDSAFIVKFVNEYKGQNEFWKMLPQHIKTPDDHNKGLIRKTCGNQSGRRCGRHKYDV